MFLTKPGTIVSGYSIDNTKALIRGPKISDEAKKVIERLSSKGYTITFQLKKNG